MDLAQGDNGQVYSFLLGGVLAQKTLCEFSQSLQHLEMPTQIFSCGGTLDCLEARIWNDHRLGEDSILGLGKRSFYLAVSLTLSG
jgi:hypothetical protein